MESPVFARERLGLNTLNQNPATISHRQATLPDPDLDSIYCMTVDWKHCLPTVFSVVAPHIFESAHTSNVADLEHMPGI